MLNALIRSSARAPHPSLLSSSYSLPQKKKPSGIRFGSGSRKPDEMDSKQDQVVSKTKDTMSSFGEGYATRSDEEGFGGIYGGNQYVGDQEKVGKDDNDKDKKSASEFDDTQGSHVKQKEKARNQEHVVTKS